jgi:hypothetical protein
MDGEPSSSPANIGSKARGPSTLAKKKLFDLSSTSSTSPFASWRGRYFNFTVCFTLTQVS